MKITRSLLFFALAGYALWVAFPMIWVAYSSLKTDDTIFRDTFALPVGDNLRWDNYERAWSEARFGEPAA